VASLVAAVSFILFPLGLLGGLVAAVLGGIAVTRGREGRPRGMSESPGVPSWARLLKCPAIGDELPVDHVGQAAAQAAHRFHGGLSLSDPATVVSPAWGVIAELNDAGHVEHVAEAALPARDSGWWVCWPDEASITAVASRRKVAAAGGTCPRRQCQAIGSSLASWSGCRAQLPAERGLQRPAIDWRVVVGAGQYRVMLGRVEREGPDEAGVPEQLDSLHRVPAIPSPYFS
jgi:hypothetical protein